MWEFFIFLIAGSIFFSFIGVIVLGVRTSKLQDEIYKLNYKLNELKKEIKPETVRETDPIVKQLEKPIVTQTAPSAPAMTSEPVKPAATIKSEPAKPVSVYEDPAWMRAISNYFKSGNLWAAGGVILLIAAFGMLIGFLARRGFFTVEMGIAAAAVCGLFMVSFGWRFRLRRPAYFLLLQGGGIGILYLAVFAAHKLTPYFPAAISLVILTMLVTPAVILALFQNSQALALLGFIGGFASPILLSSPDGNIIFLFSFYMVLNLAVLFIGFRRPWKGVSFSAFLCTFAVLLYWVFAHYEKSMFIPAELFFLGFVAVFTIIGVNGFHKYNFNKMNILLIAGTPILGMIIQWNLAAHIPHGYAIFSFSFSAIYLALIWIIWKRYGKPIRPLAEGYLALAVILANIAIPLELSQQITSAVWAAEGIVLLLLGLRLLNLHIQVWGFILHFAGAIAFFFGLEYNFKPSPPFLSASFIGSLVIGISALVMVFLINKLNYKKNDKFVYAKGFTNFLSVWFLIWFLCGWLGELNWLGIFDPLFTTYRDLPFLSENFFFNEYIFGWLAFIASNILLFIVLRNKNDKTPIDSNIHAVWIFIFILILLPVLTSSGRALTVHFNLSESWTSLMGILPSLVLLAALTLLRNYDNFVKISQTHKKLIFTVMPFILCIVLGLWFIVTLFYSGNPAPLPMYVPIINPLDLLQGFCIAGITMWLLFNRKKAPWMKDGFFVITDIMLFLWITAIIARSVHFYADVQMRHMFSSPVFHLFVFIFWGLFGIAHIIAGHKKHIRAIWIAGAIITVIDIAKLLIYDLANTGTLSRIGSFFVAGLLLLFIGWVAPLPPSLSKTKTGEDQT